MICAYCTSRIPDGSIRCEACGAAHPQDRRDDVVPTKAIGFWPWVLGALGLSVGFALVGGLVEPSGDDQPIWYVLPLVLWAFLLAPAVLIRQAIRSGRAAGGQLLLKLALAVLLSPVCFIISFLGTI
ncbi:hypothetical protein [Pontivivens insulae]|uniref:Uncharacterized protein n=1 Tax=Pontivivens insulae TaxID=1639689 RepID=A0A2R8A9Q0_9RHOB|nr:hypothetical protein [Pontivivens insulae]RED12863.1 hypothetical protein DFR53_1994 [Pontivivens insulae]SPF28954.1 hypothetical protein POI8812_01257 [Pontivivens insulae]